VKNKIPFSSDVLVIFAPNVYVGGGLVLLQEFLSNLPTNKNIILYHDQRARLVLRSNTVVLKVQIDTSIFARLCAEYSLMKYKDRDTILCFNNLPPLFPVKAKCEVYCHNALLVNNFSLAMFDYRTRLRLFLQRFIFKVFLRRIDLAIVQTPSMGRSLRTISKSINVIEFPFIPKINTVKRVLKPKWDFIYVASGFPHKNHMKLFEAWILLAQQKIYPKLLITLDARNPMNLDLFDKLNSNINLKIESINQQSHSDIMKFLAESRAIIYPSLCESFGLPLLEAKMLGKPILASELDYVRDICSPEVTFNPHSAISIARAVKRFLCIDDKQFNIKSSASLSMKYFVKKIIKSN
jgi:glycosyltransferase involved in cell wall biosynthesis